MIVLETINLTKKFKQRKALNSINISIKQGEIIGLVGPNGAGKSTLIKSILGLYNVDSGIIKICGHNVKDDFVNALANVGCIVENPDFYENISGRKNLQISNLMNCVEKNHNINRIAELVRLDKRIDDRVKQYSLGMKQRLGLCQALLNEPKLLILDEPTNGLDPLGIKELREILREINQKHNMTILISSHVLSEIENICSRIILIDNGNIIEDKSISELKNNNINLEEEFMSKVLGQID